MLAAIALFAATAATGRAADWNLQKIDGRDYVTADNIAVFYHLRVAVVPPPVGSDEPVMPPPPADDASAIRLTPSRREIFVYGVRQWLSLPVLLAPDGHTALISRLDLVKSLEPLLRPARVPGLNPVHNVVLDPGHGGHDLGARSPLGFEKNYSLDVCQRLKLLLEVRGIKTALTREDDVFIPLGKRPEVAGRLPETLFVSVHFNFTDSNPDASGQEVFAMTPQGAPSTDEAQMTRASLAANPGNAAEAQSVLLASSVQTALMGKLSSSAFDRGVKRARFAVLRRAEVPAILVEGGFLSNERDSAQIEDPAWRQRLAESIAAGIENYRAMAERHEAPKLLADYRREALPDKGRIIDPNAPQPPVEASPQPVSNPAAAAGH